MAIASARAISPVIGSEISFRAFAFQMIMRRASAMANRASIARRERPEYKTIETKEARDASPRASLVVAPTSTRRGGFAPYGRHGRRQRRII